MAQQQPNNTDQEIDLKTVSKYIKGSSLYLKKLTFRYLHFIKRNLAIIIVIFIIGSVVGWYLDKKQKVYDNHLIVIPNFGSVDYLYEKVDLLNSKIKEKDTSFIKSIGINNPSSLLKIEISPINNVYEFVNNKDKNFELLKLMAEDGNINKVLEDKITSKNYFTHNITFKAKNIITEKQYLKPLMAYFNDSQYFNILKGQYNQNLEVKLALNDSIINRIDNILKNFSVNIGSGTKSGSLIYNENTELSEVIKRRDELINEQAYLRLTKINYDKVIRETSKTLNILNQEGLNGKLKFVLPVLLVAIFLIFLSVIRTFNNNDIK